MSLMNTGYTVLTSERPLGSWVFTDPSGKRWLEEVVLPAWLPTRRWFGSKARRRTGVILEAALPVAGESLQMIAVRVRYAEGDSELYAVPLGCSPVGEIEEPMAAVVARGDGDTVLHDASFHPRFRAALLELMRTTSELVSGGHTLEGTGGTLLKSVAILPSSRVLGVEQSNTSMLWGDQLFLKLFRRLQPGVNPDAEISRFLTERQRFAYVPPFAGELRLTLHGGEAMPFGLMMGCVQNEGDAWKWALNRLAGYFAAGLATPDADTLARIGQLAQRTAELHLALSADETDPDFRPEPLTKADFAALASSVRLRLESVVGALRSSPSSLAAEFSAAAKELHARIDALTALEPGAVKTRHHGDYHLGQVLDTGRDWMIIDFEGEPLRPLAERRAKRSPLRDVAGMLRSLHYAPHAARPNAEPESLARAEAWTDTTAAVFLEQYLATARGAAFLPSSKQERNALLNAFILEKALYEVDYELNNRPDWLPIPLRGVLKVLQRS